MPSPTGADIVGLITSYVYAFGLLLIVEAVGKRLDWPRFTTRKLIHIGAGLWIWGVLLIFDQWQWGVIPFATFIGLNYIFYRRGTFEQMDSEEESPGTIYFAISITVLFALLWPRGSEPLAAAAAMILTWGDGLAALIGRRFGQRTYTFFDHTRTLEGSAAFVVASLVTATLTWLLYAPDVTGLPMALLLGGVGTVVGALAEAVSPAGLDNLTVPLLAAVAMALAGGL